MVAARASVGSAEGHRHGSPREEALTRRRPIARVGAAGAVGAAAGSMGVSDALAAPRAPRRPSTPAGALNALLIGNRRFASGKTRSLDYNRLGNRIAETQRPIAAIVTCADSRISPTVIFDLGLGNVFVSRVAGNSIDTGTLGSTEYAVAVLGVHLVMVLGHSNCGAVKAAIDVANGKKSYPASKYGAIGEVVNAVAGPVRALPPARRTLERSIVANAQAQARRVAARGPIIKPAIDNGRLRVVAAVYDIRTGRVTVV
jgi:carbonic anhydrase